MADVSTEQMLAIMAGNKNKYTFEYANREPNPSLIPSWLKDIHIDWMVGFGNRPGLLGKASHDPLEGVTFKKLGKKLWLGTNAAGDCFTAHYHNGAVALRERRVGMRKGPDGKPISTNNPANPYEVEWDTEMALMTTQQAGYGGREFKIRMAEDELNEEWAGKDIYLVGPWHGCPPDGYQELSLVRMDDKYYNTSMNKDKPWYKRGGSFGYVISNEAMIQALMHFQPHCPVAIVNLGFMTAIEPCLPETGLPKSFFVPEDKCPGHKFRDEKGYQRCLFCDTKQAGV